MQHALVLPYEGHFPKIHPTAWIAPGAVVIGDTEIGAESSVWFGAIVRGDVNHIRVGAKVNLQDGVICHVNVGDAALLIEDEVTVGHAAVLHGCTLERGCLIGIGARVLDHAVIGSVSLVGAGSVVREGARIPSGEVWAGIPAVKKRDLTAAEKEELMHSAEHYALYRLQYMGTPDRVLKHLPPMRADR